MLTISIDVFCRNEHLNYVDFIKIDVDGQDLEVLISAESIVKPTFLSFSVVSGRILSYRE